MELETLEKAISLKHEIALKEKMLTSYFPDKKLEVLYDHPVDIKFNGYPNDAVIRIVVPRSIFNQIRIERINILRGEIHILKTKLSQL